MIRGPTYNRRHFLTVAIREIEPANALEKVGRTCLI